LTKTTAELLPVVQRAVDLENEQLVGRIGVVLGIKSECTRQLRRRLKVDRLPGVSVRPPQILARQILSARHSREINERIIGINLCLLCDRVCLVNGSCDADASQSSDR